MALFFGAFFSRLFHYFTGSAQKHFIFPNIIVPTENYLLQKKDAKMSVKKAQYYITEHFSDKNKHNKGCRILHAEKARPQSTASEEL